MPRRAQPVSNTHFYTLASIAIAVATLYFAQQVLVPVAFATLFAFLLAPMASRIEKWGFNRLAATIIVVFLGLGLVGSIVWAMERQLADTVSHLPEYRQSIHSKLQGFLRSDRVVEKVRAEIQRTVKDVSNVGGAATQQSVPDSTPATPSVITPPTVDSPWIVRLAPDSTSSISWAMQYLGDILGHLATGAIIVVFVVFILLARDDLRDRMILLFGEGHLNASTEALNEAATRISRFLTAQSLINLTFGVVVAAGVWIINVMIGHQSSAISAALLAGMLCATLRFVPYLGIWIAAALQLSMDFAMFPGNGVFFATMAMLASLEFITGQLIEPHVLGSSTGISPIAVLAAALFWTWLWGPIGLLLSTPLTVLLVLIGKYAPQLAFLDILLGDQPRLDPSMRIYQRLIAEDGEDALDIAGEYLKTLSLEKVYDQILLPALATARRDWHQGHLTDPQYEFACQTIKEIVESLCEKARQHADAAQKDSKEPGAPIADSLPHGAEVHVLCLAAQDQADEIAAHMLEHLLAGRGYRVTTVSANCLASEMVDLIQSQAPDVVVVSALPPRAATHARYLLKRLLAGNSNMKIVLGLWMDSRHNGGASGVFGDLHPAPGLAEALRQIQQFSHMVIVQAKKPVFPEISHFAQRPPTPTSSL